MGLRRRKRHSTFLVLLHSTSRCLGQRGLLLFGCMRENHVANEYPGKTPKAEEDKVDYLKAWSFPTPRSLVHSADYPKVWVIRTLLPPCLGSQRYAEQQQGHTPAAERQEEGGTVSDG